MQAPNPIAFSIFGFDVRWYGILIGLGFILAIIISCRRAHTVGLREDHVFAFAIFLIPFSIIGARLYYVIFSWDYYAGDIRKILDIRSGGLAIHGGLIFGLITAYLVCRHHKIRLRDMTDLVFPQVALAQSIGRWGNFFNSEAHGGPTDLPWGIIVDGVKVHPTFLYESIWCLGLFVFLLYVSRRRRFGGQISLLYGMLYSFERFLVEALRTDSLMIGPFKQAQVLSACVFLICLVLYAVLSRRSKEKDTVSDAAGGAQDRDKEDNI